MSVPGYSPEEVAAKLGADEDLLVLDVREPYELELAKLDTAFIHVPLSQLVSGGVSALPPPLDRPSDREVVVVCHHGVRSAQVTMWLRNQGYTNALNLNGGLEAYALQVDPGIGRY